MAEADLLELIFSIFDRYWTIVQWWASVSFGLLLVAHFAAEKLRLHWIIGVVVLYAMYSAWVYLLLAYNLAMLFGYGGDLQALNAADQLSKGSKAMISHYYVGLYGMRLGWIALLTTYLACNVYLIYSYVKVRRRSNE